MITEDLDVIILGRFWGATSVGYFQQGKQLVGQLGVVTSPYYQSLYPELIKLWASGNITAYNNMLKKITLIAGVITSTAGLILSLSVPWIVKLTIGEEYLPAVSVVRIMVWGAVVAVTFNWARPTILAVNRSEVGNWASGIAAFLFLVVSFALVPNSGYTGSAISSVVPQVLGPLIIICAYARHIKRLQVNKPNVC